MDGEWGKVVRNHEPGEHHAPLGRQRLGLDHVRRHGRLVRLPRQAEEQTPGVHRGYKLDGDAVQRHAGVVVDDVQGTLEGVRRQRERLAERHLVYVVGAVGEAVHRRIVLPPPAFSPDVHRREVEDVGRLLPRPAADRHRERSADAGDKDGTLHGAPVVGVEPLGGVRRLSRRGAQFRPRRARHLQCVPAVHLGEFAVGLGGVVVGVIQVPALDVGECDADREGYAIQCLVVHHLEERVGLGVPRGLAGVDGLAVRAGEDGGGGGIGEVEGVTDLPPDVEVELGDEEEARGSVGEDGDYAPRGRPGAGALEGLGEHVEGAER
mmetsp:Transcript_6998/g.20972  ORF Transcript_6998/g.20972 Transcript_6998/m.20972 type:complete len:322 (+) Transcript_6998:646-1611(+)